MGILRRLLLVALGVVFAIILLELGLQVGALALRAVGAPSATSWLGANHRVLCVGDSNTYGLYLRDRGQAYPRQLERLWNGNAARTPIEVLNLGYPGTNSSKLVRDLPAMLRTLGPEVVLVKVGSNDFWTVPVPIEEGHRLGDTVAGYLKQYSRVAQLVHMLGRSFDQRQLEVDYPVHQGGGSEGTARFGDTEFPLGWEEAERPRGADAYRDLERNLVRIAEIVRAHGATPVFVTYGSGMWNYGDASRAIRRVATDEGVALVDPAPEIASVCPEEPCPRWLYRDHHPTAAGYELIAKDVVPVLERLVP